MKRLLFVDDEPRILEGLESMLRSERKQWAMVFVTSGEAALAELAAAPIDIIVSDIRMPQMDGITLLKQVRDRFPRTARIVLSGHTDMEETIRSIDMAHQFLSKPCEASTLKQVLDRTCRLRDLLSDEALHQAIGSIGSLPSVPRLYHALLEALADPQTTLQDVQGIIEQDVGLCAKVLQLVNSAFFGMPRPVLNIRDAVQCLGVSLLKSIILALESMDKLGASSILEAHTLEELRQHSALTASIAARICPDQARLDEVFTAAFLHDVGCLVMASVPLESTSGVAPETSSLLGYLERYVGGVTHAEIGAYLIGLWGLPLPIVEAIAYHHHPERLAHEGTTALVIVYLANLLAYEQLIGREVGIDMAYLEAHGLPDRLQEWRILARDCADGVHRSVRG